MGTGSTGDRHESKLSQLFHTIEEWLGSRGHPQERKWLHRRFRLSGPVVDWLRDDQRKASERCALAEVILRLDANPVNDSEPLFGPEVPVGMRWTSGQGIKTIFVWDPGQDLVSIVMVISEIQ